MRRSYAFAAMAVLAAARPCLAQAPANPLWDIPLSSLSETRERPLFSPARRPPPPAAPAAPPAPVAIQPAADPVPPPLVLLGVVSGPDGGGIAILQDQPGGIALRLRQGAVYQGWTLDRIGRREAQISLDGHVHVLAMPEPAPPAPGPGVRRTPQPVPE